MIERAKAKAIRLARLLEAWTLGKPTYHRKAAVELRRLSALNGELLEALHWIDRRCPKRLMDQALHKIHQEAAHDAGARARAAIARAEGKV
jgi:hypothetical protein